MKKNKYIAFVLLCIFSNIFYVKASCTDEEITLLKKEANNIKITYKHMGEVVDEEGDVNYNKFDVKIKNVSDDFYIKFINDENKLIPSDGVINETVISGTWNLEVYSNTCNEKISDIVLFLPRFNIYSLDPLCEGIDGDDFALCGKYYEYDVSYDSFVQRVKHYRATYKIDNEDENNQDDEVSYVEIIKQFVLEYYIYIAMFVGIILLIILFVIINKKRRKRGVLE